MDEGNELVKMMVPYTQLTNEKESFYVKLTALLYLSGLTLIFNVREASLDLYLFYLEVTSRGGYHQVCQEKKWGEVVSALKLDGNNATLCAQVENLYAYLLYDFEKLYFYRSPATGSKIGPVERKRISTTGLSQLIDDEDYLKAAKISEDYFSQITGVGYQELQVFQQAPTNNKEKKKRRFQQAPANNNEKKKRRCAPIGQSGYNIFLKQECARLKAYHQDIGGRKIVDMAIDAWNKLSDKEKRPYEDESKKIKEKKKEAMIIDNNQNSTQDLKRDEEMPNVCGDFCRVNSQPLSDYSFVNNAAVDLSFNMTEKISEDPFSQVI